MNLFDLSGKVAAVIGGASGIGEAVARGAAEQGATVIIFDTNEAAAQSIASRIGGSAVGLDIRDAREVGGAMDAVARDRGRLDIVVCTPSINVRKPILKYAEEEFDRVVEVNLKGSFNVLQAAGRVMTAQRRGSIVLFSSIRSQVVEPGQSVYAMTKAGIVQLVRTAAAGPPPTVASYHQGCDMTTTHKLAVIAGDGIGREVIPAGIAALDAATRGSGVSLSFTELPWGCEHYLKHQRMMDADGFEQLAKFDAIYLGAIGAPGVADGVSAALLLTIRQRFDEYVNLRPMRLLAGIKSPLAARRTADIDMVCVRENTEGEYSGVGGRIHVGTANEVAQQAGVFTRRGIDRILRYAFELAATRPRKMVASATKSNALTHSMVLWDEVADT